MKLFFTMLAMVAALSFANVQTAEAGPTTRVATVEICDETYCQITFYYYELQGGQWVLVATEQVVAPRWNETPPIYD